MENVYLCSFADSRMSPTLERVRRQAEASLFFKKVFLYDEHLLGDLFLKKMPWFRLLGLETLCYIGNIEKNTGWSNPSLYGCRMLD